MHIKRIVGPLIVADLCVVLLYLVGTFQGNSQVVQAACGAGPTIDGDITAYAMGNQYSYPNGQQHEIVIGDAAAHSGRFPWGTCIYFPYNSVTIKTADGGSVTRNTFFIWDTGTGTSDPDWVDLYHGRYKLIYQSCNCPGVPSPGYCINNSTTNSCNEAINFGRKVWWYRPDH